MFSLSTVLKKRSRRSCSGIKVRPVHRRCTVCRFAKCNSGFSLHKDTMRSAVVQRMSPLFDHMVMGACGRKLNQVSVQGRGASPEILLSTLLMAHLGFVRWYFFFFFTCTRRFSSFLLRHIITWQFVHSEERSLFQIVEKSHFMPVPGIGNPKLSSFNTQEQIKSVLLACWQMTLSLF